MKKYQVTFVIKTDCFSFKWFRESLGPILHNDEEILEYEIELIGND